MFIRSIVFQYGGKCVPTNMQTHPMYGKCIVKLPESNISLKYLNSEVTK
jgi:hypothetical protein